MRRMFTLAALAVAVFTGVVLALPAVVAADADRETIAVQRTMATVAFVVARASDPDVITAAFAPGGALARSPIGRKLVVIMPDGQRLGTAPAVRAATVVPAADFARAQEQTTAVDVVRGDVRLIMQAAPTVRGRAAVIVYCTPAPAVPPTAWWVIAALVAGAGAAAAGYRGGAGGARLVRRFTRASAAVRTGEVVVRVEPCGPRELREAADAFTAMSERVATRLAGERRASGDLPHRLRTPLAALRLRVDRLGAGAREEAARSALDRLEHEVGLLIRASGLPGGSLDGPYAGCDAAEVVAERAAYWSVLAEDQGRAVRLACPDRAVPVPLGRDGLATALDALIGNVFHHTPEGTAYAIALEPGADDVTIEISDAGPGIADPDAALRRGRSGGGSTGLGLDIARRVAESGGGGLEIGRSPDGGARIVFRTRAGAG